MITSSNFKPAWWLPGSHLQTLWPTLRRKNINIPLVRERLELPDGDFIDLDWIDKDNKQKPLVIVLHGLEGSIDSAYAKGIMHALQQSGYRVVFMHFRSCSGEPSRLPRLYHSGETSDLAFVIKTLIQRDKKAPYAAVGFSLGGSVLLKWLGETKTDNPLSCAVAISVPFLLEKVADRMDSGFSKVYQWHLLRKLRHKVVNMSRDVALPINVKDIQQVNNFWSFDHMVTAPLHGFSSVKDYYARASVRKYLKDINIRTLIIHAINDPFMTPDAIPHDDELSPNIILDILKSGGHVGFVSGLVPGRGKYWLEQRIPEFIQNTSAKTNCHYSA